MQIFLNIDIALFQHESAGDKSYWHHY